MTRRRARGRILMTAATAQAAPGNRAVDLFGTSYTLALPRLRDPRMHVAAVLLSVQVLGQTVIRFDLSIAQILLTLGVCAAIDIPMTMWDERKIAWPASALLTGNGIALLLRTPGTEHGDWWSLNGWPVFVAAAVIAVMSKYAVRIGRRHLFNPSNLGLVAVFLLFGAAHADPQELWWGPWRPGLLATVALIVAGGITLAMRMRLLDVVATFWATFAAGIGVVALTGHAMVARWSVAPVQGWDYWSILVTSPEIIIFAFFMITDPPTSPDSHRARLAYGTAIGALAAVLAATQTTEFGTKVSLLVALTVICALRPLLERIGSPTDAARAFLTRQRAFLACGAVAWLAMLLAFPHAVSSTLAVVPGSDGTSDTDISAIAAGRSDVNATTELPPVSVRANVTREAAVDPELADAITADTVTGLRIIDEALRTGDAELASAAAFGPALGEISERIAANQAQSRTESVQWETESAELVLLRDPVSPQAIPQLGLELSGTRTTHAHPGGDLSRITSTETEALNEVLLVDEVGGRWLIGQVMDATHPMVLD